MFFDSHAHLTCDPVYKDLPELLARAKEKNVKNIINICTDKLSLERGLLLAEEYDWIYNVGSTTPHDVEKEGELYFPLFEKAAKEKKFVAIGETGLDYYYEHSPKKLQQTFLQRYFQLALACNLPVVFHCREAFADLFSIANTHYKKGAPAVLHCFTGTKEEALEVINRGWYISFSGIITFKRSESLREIVKEMPLERIFIETDTPYLAPQSNRGKPNEPSFISETAEVIAQIKGITVEEVAKVSAANATSFFSLSR